MSADKNIDNNKDLFNIYTGISDKLEEFNSNNIINTNNRKSNSKNNTFFSLDGIIECENKENQKTNAINKDSVSLTSYGDFILISDNREEYKKMILDKARKKIWRAVEKIKASKSKNIDIIFNDPSSSKWYIINPDESKFKFFFNAVINLLLFVDFILTPFEYWVYESKYKFIRIVIFDSFFTLEIFLNFFTSYYDTVNKYYITDIKKIFIHYLKTSFIINVLYVTPFYIFYPRAEILRLIKLYRYPTVNNKIKFFSTFILSFIIKNITICTQIVRVLTFFLSICYIVHVCSCFYSFLGLKFTNSWIWAHSDLLNNQNILDIYISSYYFLTETLSSTGYGDLTPVNTAEILFIMFCQIINCGLYAYLLSNILDILLNKEHSTTYKIRADQINLESWIIYYMKKLPASSKNSNLHRNKIWDDTKKYFELYYDSTKNFKWLNSNNFILQMKPSERKALLNQAFSSIWSKFSKFFGLYLKFSTKFEIIKNFKTEIEITDTEITKMNKIYFIDKGIINVYKNGNFTYSLNEGGFFGIETLLKYFSDKKNIKVLYKVAEECPYVILFSINLKILINEILNYDGKGFQSIIDLANNYVNEVLMRDEKENFNMNEKNEDVIDTTDNNKLEKEKYEVNIDLLKPGCIPMLENKIKEYKRAENLIKETETKEELMDKQINFLDKYMNKIIKI